MHSQYSADSENLLYMGNKLIHIQTLSFISTEDEDVRDNVAFFWVLHYSVTGVTYVLYY